MTSFLMSNLFDFVCYGLGLTKITWKKLYEKVCKLSYFLKKINLKEKDRVAAYVPNTIESVLSFFSDTYLADPAVSAEIIDFKLYSLIIF